MIEEIDESDLKNVIEKNKIVIVDYSAIWCGPCQLQHVILEGLQREFEDKIKIVTMDIDKNAQYARDINIYAVPTLQIYYKGEVLKFLEGGLGEDRFIGVQPDKALSKICNDLIIK